MEFVVELWLPILLSSGAVFVVSSVIHMATPLHKGDMTKLPEEERVLAAMREAGVSPGQYMFPCPESMKDMGSPEMQAKFTKGPVGSIIVRESAMPQIGKSLLQWIFLSVAVSLLVAYVAWHGLTSHADFGDVMRLTGAAAFLGYGLGVMNDSIWKGLSWGITAKFVLDGLLYGVATGIVFALLW